MSPDRMSLHGIAETLGGRVHGSDTEFQWVSIDSRSLQPGELFVALSGPKFDGHAFLDEVQARGACGAIVARPVEATLPQLVVNDPRRALGQLAGLRRERFAGPLVAITGSSGKTTVKEMTAAILDQRGPALATRGNLNNDIGVPLTLLRLSGQYQAAVIEMGANHAGEIAYVTAIARPDVAVITNAGPAHLEGFGDLDGVARAKGEIFQGLAAQGTGVVNADDPYQGFWRDQIGTRRVLRFGLGNDAELGAEILGRDAGSGRTRFTLHSPSGSIEIGLPLAGRHNVLNALAASAAALAAGASLTDVRSGLESLQPVAGRLQGRTGTAGIRLIDDSYNANPASLQAALEVLAEHPGERVLVLGDMAELGASAERLHEEAGRAARRAGVHRLYALGTLSQRAVRTFGAAACHFEDRDSLVQALRPTLTPATCVLVKGSRAMRMEGVVDALSESSGS